jgi:4-amino-4-deoxy-L-arabinose transferase-like glycosyltransferase
MNRAPLAAPIAALALATSGLHAYLNVMLGSLDPAMTANAVGYVALLAAYLLLPARRPLIILAFIGYTLVTILGWVALGDKSFSTALGQIGWLDKAIEVALLLCLVIARRRS